MRLSTDTAEAEGQSVLTRMALAWNRRCDRTFLSFPVSGVYVASSRAAGGREGLWTAD